MSGSLELMMMDSQWADGGIYSFMFIVYLTVFGLCWKMAFSCKTLMNKDMFFDQNLYAAVFAPPFFV